MSGIQDDNRPGGTGSAPISATPDSPPDGAPSEGPALEIDASAAGPAISDTKPPGRRDALIRIGIVVGVLFVVFGLILPRFIDYKQVIDTLQGLTLRDYLVVSVFGVIAWIVTGAVFAMLIAGLGVIRGLEAYLILTGIGASIPLGPWNMAVLWVVIRGWGRDTHATTGGILLYGIFDQLSRFGLMFVSGLVLIVAEGLNRGISVETGLITAYLLLGGLLFIGLGGGLILVVRSERLARKVGQWAERAIGAVLHRLGRAVPDVQGALVRFRVTLGDTVRTRGLGAFIVAMASKFAWVLLMIVAMRVVGVSSKTLPDAIIMAGVAFVFVITVLPISPGGAGVPELLYISFFTAYTGGADSSAISAGVILFRAFQWGLPIPFAWVLLGISRRGKSLLPSRAEFQGGEPTAVPTGA
ncbi:MAG TPA: hypothetical protein VGQ31_12015 [Candidatus Limnocylindrales bacterium]|nr:hypothetical protein [Candidatus Limnocylindrales bacterium]